MEMNFKHQRNIREGEGLQILNETMNTAWFLPKWHVELPNFTFTKLENSETW